MILATVDGKTAVVAAGEVKKMKVTVFLFVCADMILATAAE